MAAIRKTATSRRTSKYLATAKGAAGWLADVGIALRYQPSPKLPLASMLAAASRANEPEAEGQRRALALTNTLIEGGTAIEITCVGDRVALAHSSLAPALIALARRGRTVDELALSDDARRVLEFLAFTPRPTAGMVRSYLRVPPKTWPNAADDALAELQRALVIDRGTAEPSDSGPAYLVKDGLPYRLVDDVHAKHVKAAARLAPAQALATLVAKLSSIEARKLRSLLKRLASRDEIDAAIATSATRRAVR